MINTYNTNIWDHFVCAEEYGNILKDKFNRVCSFSTTKKFQKPIISQELIKNGFRPTYPDNKTFAICLTHDIDVLFTPRNNVLKEIFINTIRLNPHLFYNIKILFDKHKDYSISSIYEILEVEAKHSAKSSFYFLSLLKNEEDFNYEVEEIGYLIDEITKLDNEIGLHGGHNAYNNKEIISIEKNRLEKFIKKEIIGYRNHFLRFETPNTWAALANSGIKYDTTFTYSNCQGYRNGMCHPFLPYNLITEKFVNILEIPPVILDSTLRGYMRIDKQEAMNYCKKTIEEIALLNGAVSLLYHNGESYGMDFYDELLTFCKQNNGWLTSAKELYLWWTKNDFCKQYNTKEKLCSLSI